VPEGIISQEKLYGFSLILQPRASLWRTSGPVCCPCKIFHAPLGGAGKAEVDVVVFGLFLAGTSVTRRSDGCTSVRKAESALGNLLSA